MSIWDAVRYGFSPVYWLTIDGVPIVWTERETGLSLPSGYTDEDAALSIDESAEVGVEHIDRDTGMPVELSFSFKLLDTTVARQWLRAPSKLMNLTADLSATATSMTVDDSTGWSNGEGAYLGLERVTLGTVASSTSVTGLTRATVGTLAYQHKAGTTSQIITDRPRFWRGRGVTLWASPVDPAGYATGSALLDDARMVWRGRLEASPARAIDGFVFQAGSIGRQLDAKLAASVTGVVQDTAQKIPASTGLEIDVVLRANKYNGTQVFSYQFRCQPFASDSDGDLLTAAEVRDRIVDAFATEVTNEGATADVGAFSWLKAGDLYKAQVLVKADATITNFEIFVDIDGKNVVADWFNYPAGWGADGNVALKGWQSQSNPLAPNAPGVPAVPWMLTVRVDDGDPSTIPTVGLLSLKYGGVRRVFAYLSVTTSGTDAYFVGLKPVPDGPWPTHAQLVGAEAEVLFADTGVFSKMMLRCLMSSGNGERSATYDTLARAQGYGFDEGLVNEASFTTAAAPVSTLKGGTTSGSKSFSELFGGVLGLFRKAVVPKPDSSDANYAIKLTLVDTAPFGAGYKTTVSDSDLLSNQADPVESVKRAPSPNVLEVVRPHGDDADSANRFIFADEARAEAEGRVEVKYEIPATSRPLLWKLAEAAAASHFAADQTTQVVELRVGPWIDAEVGDVIRLNSTHPSLWQWSGNPASPGYIGSARVVGRPFALKKVTARLIVLAGAAVQNAALSPAAEISAFDHATAPTQIDIPFKYLTHMQTALTQAGGNIWLYHFKPGQVETVTEKHEVSAAASTGGGSPLCRLTIASTSGGHTLVLAERSTLTLPTTDGGDLSSWQGDFAHVDDGTRWG